FLVDERRIPLTRLPFPIDPSVTAVASKSEGIRLATEGKVRGQGAFLDYRGMPVLGAYTWLPMLQLALIVEQDQAEIFGSVAATLLVDLVVALVAVLIAMVISSAVAQGIATPLRVLASTAGRIAAGELELVAPIQRQDELGKLAGAFNLMTGRLRNLIEELKAELAERRKAEENLRLEHLKALQYFENAAVLMVVLDTRAEVVELNRQGHEILEYAEGELRGRDWFRTCLPASDYAEARETFDRLIGEREDQVEVNESLVLTKSGKLRLIRFHNSFVRDAEGKISGVLRSGEDITEQRQAEEQIRKSLAEKETLLRELHHRTKNNMGVIIALLDLQAAETGHEQLRSAFADTQNRIRSMALVHQKLYEADDLSRINLKDYLRDLSRLLLSSYQVQPDRISIDADLEDVIVLIDTAIPCGLILNELISNALKYAFPGEMRGRIETRLRRLEGGEIELRVSDNGVGLPAGFDVGKDGHMGMRTIFSLGKDQLNGEVRLDRDRGLACTVIFRDDRYLARV
ncbi:MAG: histidine kinase dimerization/phosphoacceptor domain -containing protein, partial [Spirochaetota bacterium]